MSSKIKDITEADFKRLMEGDRPVLAEFWAPWCVYCRRISEAYDKVGEQYGDILEIVRVNIDDEKDLAKQEHIDVIPTLRIFRDGQAVSSVVAPKSKAAIDSFIRNTMGTVDE